MQMMDKKPQETAAQERRFGTLQEPPVHVPPSFVGEDPATLLDYYAQMVLLRRFEERTGEMYTKAKIGGYCHLNLGEEATIVGLCSAMAPQDYMYTNYREHGYAIARGITPQAVMAELFGRETGCSKGRGGSMHLFDMARHFMGGYAIVGGQIPLATGAAFAIKYNGGQEVVVCQMGDGTTAIGAFHESLNIAALQRLPIVYLIINNFYGMGTTIEHSSAVPELYRRAAAYNMPGQRVDGLDVLSVRDAARQALALAREQSQPNILETLSYRLRGHSVVDPARYRAEEEVKRWRALDPLRSFGQDLQEAGLLEPERAKEIEEQAERTVQEAIDFANQSPQPRVEDLYTFMYASPLDEEGGQA